MPPRDAADTGGPIRPDMLKELKIRNLAIIEDLTVRFEEGFNVLTGETGAGKSIIVDALGLALGNRAQSDLIRAGEKEASVQAFFEVGETSALPDIGVDLSDSVLLRRVLLSGGKSRAYVNDTLVTLQSLAGVGKALVDIHSQHEHQSLLIPDRQRMLLDSYGRLEGRIEETASLYDKVATLRQDCRELHEMERQRAHRLDLLRFQVNEIESAGLRAGEKEDLAEERKILSNVRKLNDLAEAAYSLLYGTEGSCSEQMNKAVDYLKEMSAIDEGLGETAATLESALPLLEDATISLRGYRDRWEAEPGRLEAIEERLAVIRGLEKKYGEGVEAVLRYGEDASREIAELESADERAADKGRQLESLEAKLEEMAEALSARRRETAARLQPMVEGSLSELAFENAGFRIEVRQEADEGGRKRIGRTGMDRVEFLFSANRGEPLKPLARIVSGGELSRVMLALKSILAGVDSVPVLIFDEVDAGIGGKTAGSVGEKLARISAGHQLLCITHLPQIASLASVHLKIEKRTEKGRTRVEVRELEEKERRDEIARMLSGTVTEISRRHAGELLERVR